MVRRGDDGIERGPAFRRVSTRHRRIAVDARRLAGGLATEGLRSARGARTTAERARHEAVGKTIVSSGIIDRVADRLGAKVVEVPVGFKWFVAGLINGSLGFGGEESAGASFLRRDGSVWTTDKDGLIPGLLAAEITAVTGRDPGETFGHLTDALGMPFYERIDAPATQRQKDLLKKVTPDQFGLKELAGEPVSGTLTTAPGNGAAIGGIKVSTENGWFAARPSGTEDVYKIYAESFLGDEHLRRIQQEARDSISRLFAAAVPA